MSPVASASARKSSGRTVLILAGAFAAAAESAPSPRFATQREPNTIASISA